jgi:hypothetical protein
VKLSFIVSAILLSVTCKTYAYIASEGNISTYFGPFIHKTNFTGSNSGAKSLEKIGAGLVLLGDLNDHASLEIGFFLLDKTYFRDVNLSFVAEETKLAHISMGYRRWFNSIFSGSLTFFSAYSMGDSKYLHSDFAVGSEIDTSARDTTEYGFDIALQAEVFKQPSWSVVVDTRYSLSVTGKKGENADHYGVLVGLLYRLQDKNPNDNLK